MSNGVNKLIIPIIVVIIIAAGIGAYFIFQRPAFPEPQLGKCGDGVCDSHEQANPNLCPKDCEEIPSITQQELEKGWYWGSENQKKPGNPDNWIHDAEGTRSACWHKPDIRCGRITVEPSPTDEDSPFGIFGPYEPLLDSSTRSFISKSEINNYLKDIGVKWIQEMPRGNNLYEVAKSGVNIYSRALPIFNTPPQIPEEYKTWLKKTIKQYKDKIKYWEADTEPSGFLPPIGWKGHPKKYAEFLKVTYEIIKSECPNCKVVFGGLPGVRTGLNENSYSVQFLKSVLDAGGAKYFDVFEFKQHAYNADDYPELKNKIEVYGKTLSQYGIDIKKIPVFIETAMYDGDPNDTTIDPTGKFLPPQTEIQQASALIKIYVYGLAQGIDKIFWNLVIENGAGPNTAKSVFPYYGLVNNPDNDGQSHRKLSYYTYKKMVEILEGSDWGNIQTIQESNDVYVYKFTKEGKPIWVAWNDNSQEKQITIFGITSSQVKISEAVPKYESGKEVKDYSTAFETETKTVNKGIVAVTLGEIPVFIESLD